MTDDARKTVLFTNNYSMPAARAEWLAGRAPGHHLCGAPELVRSGYDVKYLPYHEGARTRYTAALRSRFGAARLQAAALAASSDAICYSADPFSFSGLALLRAARRTERRIVANIHPKAVRSRLRDRGLRGYDGCITLSKVVQAELIDDVGRPAELTRWLPWGPDLAFRGYVSKGSGDVVCSGKTNRDHRVLLDALARAQLPATVHLEQLAPSHGANVRTPVRAPYARVLEDLQHAAVVAIPLLPIPQLAGITELNDALALSKPVVMTRSEFIDVDVESVGCGILVEPGDVEGWVDALRRLMADPDLRARMGHRGREFAEREWNAELFGRGVVELMDLVGAR